MTGGRQYDPAQVKRAHATYETIKAALLRGALSRRSAVTWAARAGRGENVAPVIAALAGSEWRRQENRRVSAHSNSQLATQILNLLSQAVDGAPDAEDDEFAAIFPPTTTTTTLVYDPQDSKGNRPAPRTVDQPVVPPGYKYGTTDNQTNRWASARRDRYDDADVISDDQADQLFPAATAAEAERRRRAAIEAAAGRIEDLDTEQLHDLLFGSSAGREA